MLYKHKDGYYVRFIKKTDTENLNWYLIVNEYNEPILNMIPFFTHPIEQRVLINGYDNLIHFNAQLTLF